MVAREMPPSTWIDTCSPAALMAARVRSIFGIICSMKDWLPKPGSTVSDENHVEFVEDVHERCDVGRGFSKPGPRVHRCDAARGASRSGAAAASAWKVTDSQPTSAYCGAQRSGSSIMRCASTGRMPDLTTALRDGQTPREVGDEMVVHDVDTRRCPPLRS